MSFGVLKCGFILFQIQGKTIEHYDRIHESLLNITPVMQGSCLIKQFCPDGFSVVFIIIYKTVEFVFREKPTN